MSRGMNASVPGKHERGGDERQKGDRREADVSVEKGTTVSQRSDLRGLELKTSRLGGSKDVDGVAAGIDSSEGIG